jgi:hypothetical protein
MAPRFDLTDVDPTFAMFTSTCSGYPTCMNLPVQPGAGTLDGGALRRRVSVTESGAQSANFACHPGDRSLHISLTSSDRSVCAMVMTCDAVRPLAKTLGGGALSTGAAHATPRFSTSGHSATTRHRLYLGHFHRPAPIWDAAEPWR